MSDINTERSNGILRIELNRPEKKNAMTGGMYTQLADIFNEADGSTGGTEAEPDGSPRT